VVSLGLTIAKGATVATKELSDLTIAAASMSDLDDIIGMLIYADLPIDGVSDHIRNFIVARDGGRIVGCGGAEAYPFAALLRSIAVDPEYQHIGLGRRIVRELLDRLASRGLREFYLLTTAEGFFKKRGFKPIDRDEIHPQLLASAELQGACPESAVCMRLVMH
jgi:amino-acid N-acetyltransferase